MKQLLLISLTLLLITSHQLSFGDVLFIEGGDRITGSVISMRDNKLTISTTYAGRVELDWSQVQSVKFEEPIPVLLIDGDEVYLMQIPDCAITLSEITAINPPPAPIAHWRGRVDLGYAQTGGNRDSLLGALTAYLERAGIGNDRHTFRLSAARGRSEGEETANRARLEGKIDRAAGRHDYRYLLGSLGYDKIRETDLRVELGAGLGRTLRSHEKSLLTAELGLSYLREEFAIGEKKQDAMLRLGQNWRRSLGNSTELRQSLVLLGDLNDYTDFTSEFLLAMTYRLTDRMALTTQLTNLYDSRPPPETERSDYTITTQLGYTFGP